MTRPVPPRHYGGDPQLQENQEGLWRGTANAAILDGRIIEIQLTAGSANKVAHGLGRRFRGWVLIGSNEVNGDRPVETYDQADGDKFITLTPATTHTVRLWVF